ncbi:MAG: hypothetical protein Q8Q09_02605 [Deltaproteobacteria bacterium]|nr:hypothetical protein [Deltaproteobacteria bacterium]
MSFGNPPGGGGPFGPPSGNGGGAFGAPPSDPNAGAFGAPPSQGGAFGAPPSQGPFAPVQSSDPNAGAFGGAPPSQGGAFGAPPSQGAFGGAPPSQGGAFGGASQSQGAFGGAPPAQGGAFGAPQSGGFGQQPQMGGFGQQPQMGGFGQQPQMGGFGQPQVPTGNGSTKVIAIVAGVLGVIMIAAVGLGIAAQRERRARERRLEALRSIQYSLASARSNYTYGNNTYGNNYGGNTYRPTNPYGTGSTATIPSAPTFISNTGNRSIYEITAQINARQGSFQACAANDSTARSQMAVRFMVGSNGRVLTSFGSPGSGSSAVDTCVNSMVRTMFFRPSTGFSIVVHPITIR